MFDQNYKKERQSIMLWGSFGAVHLISLLAAVGMMIGIYFILKNKTEKVQRITLF